MFLTRLSNPILFGMNQMPKKSQDFNKVADCPYKERQ